MSHHLNGGTQTKYVSMCVKTYIYLSVCVQILVCQINLAAKPHD